MIRYSNRPVTEARRRLIVRADSPASPSSIRTTDTPRRGCRWDRMNASTSASLTSTGSLPTTAKRRPSGRTRWPAPCSGAPGRRPSPDSRRAAHAPAEGHRRHRPGEPGTARTPQPPAHSIRAHCTGSQQARRRSPAYPNQATHAEVLFSRSVRVRIGPVRNGEPSRTHSVLYSPIVVSQSPLFRRRQLRPIPLVISEPFG